VQIAKATNISVPDEEATDSPQKPPMNFALYYRARRNHLVVLKGDYTRIFLAILRTLKCINSSHQSLFYWHNNAFSTE
jgi:hypothetical protein